MIDYFEIATSACGLLAMTIPIYDLFRHRRICDIDYLLLGLRFFTAFCSVQNDNYFTDFSAPLRSARNDGG